MRQTKRSLAVPVFDTYANARDRLRPGDMILILSPGGFVIIPRAFGASIRASAVPLQHDATHQLDHENVIGFVRRVA
jgi:hypothetical protein